MHRVTECKASPDYKLWLKFEDGLEGSVYLGISSNWSPSGIGGM